MVEIKTSLASCRTTGKAIEGFFLAHWHTRHKKGKPLDRQFRKNILPVDTNCNFVN